MFIFVNVKTTCLKINSRSFQMCALIVSGTTCTPDVPTCQCNYNKTTDNVHFVVNGARRPDMYNAIIRAHWQHGNLSNVYSNNNYTVPGPGGKLICYNVMLILFLYVSHFIVCFLYFF